MSILVMIKKKFSPNLQCQRNIACSIQLFCRHLLSVRHVGGRAKAVQGYWKKVNKWICICCFTEYKLSLIHVGLLPLPIFTHVLDLLLLPKITTSFPGFELDETCARKENARRQSTNFHIRDLKTQFACSSFICWTLRLAKGLPPDFDISDQLRLKTALLEQSTGVFLATYSDFTPCTWRILC